MSYFLKKTRNKKGTYLQIYSSFYSPVRLQTVHKSYKPIGYVHELEEQGIDDPIKYFQAKVDELNQECKYEKQLEKRKKISNESPESFLGYCLHRSLNEKLGIRGQMEYMQAVENFKFNVYDFMSALVYSRLVRPCSKYKTFENVIPKLFEKNDFSMNQMYVGLDFIGSQYERIIEIYNHQIKKIFNFDTAQTYFDCTNFYFEIDKEDEFRRKGPSKENRKEPIVGLGLLLDANQIPIGMKLYPGNCNEKPILRQVINDLKERHSISGRTIQIADKGLNCAENIYVATKNLDGYIFSKSVRQLPEIEQTWVLLPNDYKDITDKDGNLIYKMKEHVDDFKYSFKDDSGNSNTFVIREKRIVTYNPKLAEKQIYEIRKQVEKATMLCLSKAKKSEFGDCAKYVNFTPVDKEGNETSDKIKVSINHKLVQRAIQLAGYNLLVTSEINMSATDIYNAYHNLWRIEESFRMMKSQLDARPVFLQKTNTITGHFLICYISVLLTRLLQFKVLKNQYSTETIFNFVHDFRVVKSGKTEYINLTKMTSFIEEISKQFNFLFSSYYFTDSEVKKMLNLSLK